MKFRVVVAGEGSMYVHSRNQELSVGDTFKISPESQGEFRVRGFAYSPVDPDQPEMLIQAERVS